MPRLAVLLLGNLVLLSISCKDNAPSDNTEASISSDRAARKAELTHQEQASLEEQHALIRDTLISRSETFFSEFLTDKLAQNEELTLQALARLEGDFNYPLIGDTLFAHFQQKDLSAGLDAFRTLDSNITLVSPLLAKFLTAYAEKNPSQAQQWLVQNTDLNGIPNAAHSLGNQSPINPETPAFFDQIRALDLPSSIKSNYLEGLVGKWVETDFNAAFDHLSKQDASPVLDRTYLLLVDQAFRVSPDHSILWAENISDPGLRRSAILQAGQQWHIKDIEAYQRWKDAADLPEDLRAELP